MFFFIRSSNIVYLQKQIHEKKKIVYDNNLVCAILVHRHVHPSGWTYLGLCNAWRSSGFRLQEV